MLIFDFGNMNKKTEYLSIVFRGGPANRFFQYHTATYLAKIWNKVFVFDASKELPNGSLGRIKALFHETDKYRSSLLRQLSPRAPTLGHAFQLDCREITQK